jgi:hypothetical protein
MMPLMPLLTAAVASTGPLAAVVSRLAMRSNNDAAALGKSPQPSAACRSAYAKSDAVYTLLVQPTLQRLEYALVLLVWHRSGSL